MEEALKNARALIGKGFIKKCYPVVHFNDEPKFPSYACWLKKDISTISDGIKGEEFSGGCSVTIKERAEMKALGEAIERYSLSIFRYNNMFTGSYNNIKQKGESAVDLDSIKYFSDKQLKQFLFKRFRITPKSKMRWEKTQSLRTGDEVYVPVQTLRVPYFYFKDECIVRFPVTTGAAASTSYADAIYRGICEVVERDSYMISYLNKLEVKKR